MKNIILYFVELLAVLKSIDKKLDTLKNIEEDTYLFRSTIGKNDNHDGYVRAGGKYGW